MPLQHVLVISHYVTFTCHCHSSGSHPPLSDSPGSHSWSAARLLKPQAEGLFASSRFPVARSHTSVCLARTLPGLDPRLCRCSLANGSIYFRSPFAILSVPVVIKGVFTCTWILACARTVTNHSNILCVLHKTYYFLQESVMLHHTNSIVFIHLIISIHWLLK